MTLKEAIRKAIEEQNPGWSWSLVFISTATLSNDENAYDTESFDEEKFAERVAELLKQ
jgi:hypothetical protein